MTYGLDGSPPQVAGLRPPTPSRTVRLPELDGIRGIAAVLVLLFSLRDIVPSPITRVADSGFLMADLFFVLSGFVLARPLLTLTGPGEATRFMVRRVVRLLPLFLAGWGVTVWLSGGHIVSQATNLALAPFHPPAGPTAGWLWVELATGLLIAGVISRLTVREPGGDSFDRRKFVPLGAMALGLIIVIVWPTDTFTDGPITVARGLLGFGLGMLTFVALDRRTSGIDPPLPFTEPGPGFPPGSGALLAIIGLVICLLRTDLVLELRLLPTFALAAGLIYCCAQPDPAGWPVHRLLLTPAFQWLGSRSYGLFALHPAILAALKHINSLDDAGPAILLTVATLGSLGAAELGYRLSAPLRGVTEKPEKKGVLKISEPGKAKRRRAPERETIDLANLSAAEALALLAREGALPTKPGRATLADHDKALPKPSRDHARMHTEPAASSRAPLHDHGDEVDDRSSNSSRDHAQILGQAVPLPRASEHDHGEGGRRVVAGRDNPVIITAANIDYSLAGAAARKRSLPVIRRPKPPEPMPLIPEPMRPPKEVDLRSIPPELRLRPLQSRQRDSGEDDD